MMRAERGFSLIELMLCVALIGILLKVALPRFNFSKQYVARASARRIVGDLRFARHLAIMNGTPYIVVFDPALSQYKLYKNSVSGANQVTETRQLATSIILSGNSSFTFQNTGQVTQGTSLGVSSGGYTWTITVTPATGYIHMQ